MDPWGELNGDPWGELPTLEELYAEIEADYRALLAAMDADWRDLVENAERDWREWIADGERTWRELTTDPAPWAWLADAALEFDPTPVEFDIGAPDAQGKP